MKKLNQTLKVKVVLFFTLSLMVAGVSGCVTKETKAETTTVTSGSEEASAESADSTGGENSTLKVLNIGYPIGGIDFIDGIAGIAKEKGYLDEALSDAGYQINYIGFSGAGPAVNEALASGKIDLALYADFPGIVITSKGVKTKLISVITGEMHAGILVANDSLIKSVADLKDKKIAFPKGTYIQKYLLQLLNANQIAEDEVELINMTTDAESALLSGAVDAVASTDGLIALIQDKGNGVILNTSRENTDWAGAIVLIGNSDYLENNRDAGVAFLKGLIRAQTFANENPEEVYSIFSEKTTLSIEATKAVYGRDDNRFDYYSLDLGTAALSKIDVDKKFLLDSGLIQDDFDVNGWSDSTYYETAKSEVSK